MNHIEAMKQALEALERCDGYRSWPWMQEAKSALRTAIEQAAVPSAERGEAHKKQKPVCRYPRCSCNSKDFCDPKRQQALDKMAENERALGIQMKPCDCAAKSAADCVCGSWDSLPAAQRQWVGLIRGVRVDGDNVIVSTKNNDTARQLCGELLRELNGGVA
jgi:hypothetical protein